MSEKSTSNAQNAEGRGKQKTEQELSERIDEIRDMLDILQLYMIGIPENINDATHVILREAAHFNFLGLVGVEDHIIDLLSIKLLFIISQLESLIDPKVMN